MNNMMNSYADFVVNVYITLGLIWALSGAGWRMFILKRERDKGKDVSVFDLFTVVLCAAYGPVYVAWSLLFHVILKVDNWVVFKGKTTKVDNV